MRVDNGFILSKISNEVLKRYSDHPFPYVQAHYEKAKEASRNNFYTFTRYCQAFERKLIAVYGEYINSAIQELNNKCSDTDGKALQKWYEVDDYLNLKRSETALSSLEGKRMLCEYYNLSKQMFRLLELRYAMYARYMVHYMTSIT